MVATRFFTFRYAIPWLSSYQFAYVASHDLKAPLRAIGNLASWLDEDVGDTLPATSREHLGKLRLRVQRMEHLLEDLLTYSRVGRRDRAQEEINVNGLLQNIVDLLAPPSGFTVTVAPAIPLVHTPRAPFAWPLCRAKGRPLPLRGQKIFRNKRKRTPKAQPYRLLRQLLCTGSLHPGPLDPACHRNNTNYSRPASILCYCQFVSPFCTKMHITSNRSDIR